MTDIDEIKQRVDMVELASEYVAGLKKAGRNFRAPCPFHSERDPSFYVFPDRQSWHCFGACGTGGDIFSFVMKKEGVDFGEALRILARRAGVTLASGQRDGNQREADRLKETNEVVSEYYHRLLRSEAGQQARSYLGQRGISDRTVEDFQLGLSPDSWEALREYLIGKGYREEELLAGGLLKESEKSRAYDRFRNRLMFPIRSADGRVVGFGARALDDSMPKYLNSPQTPVFDKSSTLYGIDRARSAIRGQDLAIVVEGYMDAIAAHQHGFTNVIASLGTALTGKQVGIVKKLTKNITLALDADAAGQMATLRGQEVISQAFGQPTSVSGWTDVKYENPYNAEWKVVILPQGKDPDEIIRDSPEEWRRLVEQAMPVIDYVFYAATAKLNLAELRDKSAAADQLLPVVNGIRDPVAQAHYLQKLARLVGVDEGQLASALRKLRLRTRPRQGGETERPSALVSPLRLGDPLAEYCLALLVRYPRLRERSAGISAELFPYSEGRQLFLMWRDSDDVDSLTGALDGALQGYLDMLREKPLPPMSEGDQEEALDDCVHRLRQRWLKDLKGKEQALISDFQTEGNEDGLEELQQLGLELNKQLWESFLQGRGRNAKSRETGV